MADLTITAANVVKSTGAVVVNGVAGASLTAGQPVYSDGSDGNKYKPASCESSLAIATVVGVCLHAAASGQPMQIQTAGDINLGATLVVGETYFLSAPGLICPAEDLGASDYVTRIGYAKSTSILALDIKIYGVEYPS